MLTIDRREVHEMIEHRHIASVAELSTLIGIPVVEDTLDAGDFAFLNRYNEPVGIERCEIRNLMQKIRSGELEAQLVRCDENYSNVILLTEGVYDHVAGFLAHYKKTREGNSYYRNRIEPNFRYSEVKALEIRLSELGIEVMGSPNFVCSMSLIETIYQQRTKPEEQHTLFKKVRAVKIPVRMSANPAVPKLMALCPRLPEKVAIRLIYQYNSIWTILNTPDEMLLEVEGFGRGLLDKLKKGVGK